MHVLLLALCLQAPSTDGAFVPVLHHAQRTPVEWLDELETTRGSSSWDPEEDGMGMSWDQWQEVNGPHLAYAPGIRLWILKFVGSAYVVALASELDRAETAERRMTMLRAIEATSGDIGPAMGSLEALLEGSGEEARIAKALRHRALGM